MVALMESSCSAGHAPCGWCESATEADITIAHLRHDSGDPGSLIDDRVNAFWLDRSGALWVGTEAGLDRWQPEHHGFLHSRSLGAMHVSRLLAYQPLQSPRCLDTPQHR